MTELQEEKNTIIFLFIFLLRNVKRSLNLKCDSQITNPYSKLDTVADCSFLTYINKGLFIDTLIKSSTFLVYVAENSTVYHFLGIIDSIEFTSSSNPFFIN